MISQSSTPDTRSSPTPRPRRFATSLIILGCILGVIGMVGFFSWPGIVLICLSHVMILFGSVWGRSWRIALSGLLAMAIVWAIVFRGAII